MRAQHAGDGFRAVEGRPAKVVRVFVEEPRGEDNSPFARHIGQGHIMAFTVEMGAFHVGNNSLLNGPQGFRTGTTDHERPAGKVVFMDEILSCQGIIRARNQVNFAGKEGMDINVRDLADIFVEVEDNIIFPFEKPRQTIVPVKARGHRSVGMGGLKGFDDPGQEGQGTADRLYDADVLGILTGHILSLFHGNLEIRQNVSDGRDKLFPRRRQGDSSERTVEDSEADFFFDQFDLISEGRLRDVESFCGPVEIPGFHDGEDIFHLFRIHN